MKVPLDTLAALLTSEVLTTRKDAMTYRYASALDGVLQKTKLSVCNPQGAQRRRRLPGMAEAALLAVFVLLLLSTLPAKGQVVPEATCLDPDNGFPGFSTVHFGYYNYEESPISLSGSQNQISPAWAVPPANFSRGYYPNVLELLVENDESVTWTLSGTATTVGPGNVASIVQSVAGPSGYSTQTSTQSVPFCTPTLTMAPLAYSAAGTYPHQYLADLDAPGNSVPPTIAALNGSSNIAVSNLQIVYNDTVQNPNLPDASNGPTSVYGDVIIAPGPMTTANIGLDVIKNGVVVATGLEPITFSGSSAATSGCPAVVTSSVKGSLTTAAPVFGTAIWTQTLSVTNTSGEAISGPIQVVLTNLSANARLFGASGTATCSGLSGAPYLYITGTLAPNATAAVVLTFTNSQVPAPGITYTPVIVSGGTQI